jgi:hypothetical protein
MPELIKLSLFRRQRDLEGAPSAAANAKHLRPMLLRFPGQRIPVDSRLTPAVQVVAPEPWKVIQDFGQQLALVRSEVLSVNETRHLGRSNAESVQDLRQIRCRRSVNRLGRLPLRLRLHPIRRTRRLTQPLPKLRIASPLNDCQDEHDRRHRGKQPQLGAAAGVVRRRAAPRLRLAERRKAGRQRHQRTPRMSASAKREYFTSL